MSPIRCLRLMGASDQESAALACQKSFKKNTQACMKNIRNGVEWSWIWANGR
jgi:hypothetical protein